MADDSWVRRMSLVRFGLILVRMVVATVSGEPRRTVPSVFGSTGRSVQRLARAASARFARLVAVSSVVCLVLGTLVVAATPASASAQILYAAPTGVGSGNCSDVADACGLQTALSGVTAGGTIELVTSGDESNAGTFYSGGFSIATPGTSASAPVTIEPAPGVTDPILDGGNTQTVLTVGNGAYLTMAGVTVQRGNGCGTDCVIGEIDAGGIANNENGTIDIDDSTFLNNVGSAWGGAIENGVSGSGTAIVSDSTFTDNRAGAFGGGFGGGAIASGVGYLGVGTLTVTNSTFSANSNASWGGAIVSGWDGSGTLTVAGSTFSNNGSTDGGAIDVGDGGDDSGDYTSSAATITESTFSDNSATNGGSIDNGDDEGYGNLTVASSTFSENSATDGGAIDNSYGSLAVTDSTFSNNSATDGGAVDNADNGGASTSIANSTLFGNTASDSGAAVDDADNGGSGTLAVTQSTLSGNVSADTIDNGQNSGTGSVTVGADIIAGSCGKGQGTWSDEGYNVAEDTSCFNGGASDNDTKGTDLPYWLVPLADNGGPTQTMALIAGNPAVGIVPNTTPNFCPVSADQRGLPSPAGQACNAGSVQARPPLSIGSGLTLPSATTNVDYSDTLWAQGGIAPYSWSKTGGSLPPGLNFSSTGTISGIPTAESGYGPFSFTVEVTDSSSPKESATETFSLSLVPSLYVSEFTASQGGEVVAMSYNLTQRTVVSDLKEPTGVAVDRFGNLYVAEYGANRVDKVTPEGKRSVYISKLDGPEGVAVNAAGDVFVAEALSDQVVEKEAGKKLITLASLHTQPYGIATDASGNVYVGELDASAIVKIAPSGTVSTFATGHEVMGIATDSSGNVYASDYLNSVVDEFSPTGTLSTVPLTGLEHPDGVAVDSSGNFFVVENSLDEVVGLYEGQRLVVPFTGLEGPFWDDVG